MEAARSRTGRKPKGNRKPVRTMLPVEVVDIVDAVAAESGLDRTAVLGRLLCERLGLEVPSYCLPKPTDQEELPLSQAS